MGALSAKYLGDGYQVPGEPPSLAILGAPRPNCGLFPKFAELVAPTDAKL